MRGDATRTGRVGSYSGSGGGSSIGDLLPTLLQGARWTGAIAVALPVAALNNSEIVDTFVLPVSSGHEAAGNNSDSDVDRDGDADGPTDVSNGGSLVTSRKTDNNNSEGERENHPRDRGPQEKPAWGEGTGGAEEMWCEVWFASIARILRTTTPKNANTNNRPHRAENAGDRYRRITV